MPRAVRSLSLAGFSSALADLTERVLRATVAIAGPTPDGGSMGSGGKSGSGSGESGG